MPTEAETVHYNERVQLELEARMERADVDELLAKALALNKELESENDELRQRLFELQEAKAALTPKI